MPVVRQKGHVAEQRFLNMQLIIFPSTILMNPVNFISKFRSLFLFFNIVATELTELFEILKK